MRSGSRGSASGSGEIFLQPGVGGVDELFGCAVEDNLSLVEDEKLCAVVDAVVWDGLDLAGLLVEAVGGQQEGVLEAMRDDKRCGVACVALFDEQLDDGGRSDGVEAAGGRIVKDKVRIGDDGAGDGDAAAHTSGEFGWELRDGLL